MKYYDVIELMTELAEERPVFHSEADFQFALAWIIKESDRSRSMRLERRFPGLEKRMSMDIQALSNESCVNFELKYTSVAKALIVDGEKYELQNQGAHDIRRYDFWKDVQRLEQMNALVPGSKGFAIFLTCSSTYQKPGRKTNAIDRQFWMDEGRRVFGDLAWSEDAGEGTVKGRSEPLQLAGEYECHWQPFSTVEGLQLSYLLLEVVAVSSTLPSKSVVRAPKVGSPGTKSRNTSYARFAEYLSGVEADSVTLSFTEIERIVGTLPPSARLYDAWWSNHPSQRLPNVWLKCGFVKTHLDISGESVTLKRTDEEG